MLLHSSGDPRLASDRAIRVCRAGVSGRKIYDGGLHGRDARFSVGRSLPSPVRNKRTAWGVAKHREQEGTWGVLKTKSESLRDPCFFQPRKYLQCIAVALEMVLNFADRNPRLGLWRERNSVPKYY